MSDDSKSRHIRTYRKVAQKMLAALDSGEFPAGARLPPERELSERYGVSRPTIREAIIALEVMGRVEVRTGSGVYALKTFKSDNSNPGDYSPFEVMEARVLIESEAAALAASTITAEDLEKLEAALGEIEQENIEGNLTSEVADKKFHFIIANATQNHPLVAIIKQLWDIQTTLPDLKAAHQSVCQTDGKLRYLEHKAILDALKKHDPRAARSAMQNHFSRMLNALHTTTEQRAVEEIRKQLSEQRKRFSINRIQHVTE